MGKHSWFLISDDKLSFISKTFSAYTSARDILFEMTDSVKCETINLIKFQPSHSVVDSLGNLGALNEENLNPDSC